MEEKFLIDKKTLKAISVDTRMNIMKLLSKKKYTLSDLSSLLSLGVSTIKEHLDNLIKAGLIEKEKTDRKWKFYSLTLKGRRLVEPREIKVLFAFMISFISAIGFAYYYAKEFLFKATGSVFGTSECRLGSADRCGDLAGAYVAEYAILESSADNAAPAAAEELVKSGAEKAILESSPVAAEEIVKESSYAFSQNQIFMSAVLIFLIGLSMFLLGYYLKKKIFIIQRREK